MPLKMYVVFGLATSANLHTHKTIAPEVYSHTESIGASLVGAEHKTVKLFKFLKGPTQCEHTIVLLVLCTAIIM